MRTIIVFFCLVAYASAVKRMRRQNPFEDCLNKPGTYCDYSCKSGYAEDPTLRCGIITNKRCCAPRTTLPPSVTTIVPPLHICGISKFGTECGKMSKTTRIIGGQDAYPNEFPVDSQHICGGSIISSNWILTAAHCFSNLNVNSTITLSKMRVVAGEHRQLNSDGTEVYAKLAKVVIHKDYDPNIFSSDIAMIKLQWPGIIFNSNMREICLPDGFVDYDRIPVVVAGWGFTDPSPYYTQGILANTLQKVELITVNKKQCQEENAPKGFIVDQTMMCATGGAKDECFFDSGNPIIMRQSDGQSFTQIGIVSHGVSCGSGYPGIHTRVSPFHSWIKQVVATE